MPTAPTLTIGEARPNVSRARIYIGTALLVSWIFAAVVFAMRIAVLPSDPTLLSRVPWLLPLWTLWGVYLSLAFVVRSYANLYLPRTPVAVDEAINDVGLVAIGCGQPMEAIIVGLPVGDERIVMSCTGVVAAFVVGLLAFWVWLVRTYGGPAQQPSRLPSTDAKAG
ncbi:hypothetical protein BAE44_0024078 [Dichanthelium oligosanthes]|uniref:DUF7378 domain-containing protein n=1 Tax=Dichanthelium oligosanthes TaxID=888268 RepID=A0A1E5UPW5_9POAL|nr:hypothetical protein BAE44_0024078 [Dichanthelium oligosanthes]